MKALKSELAALDRKITAALAPKHDNVADGEAIKPTAPQHQSTNITPPQSSKEQEDKSSLVAEPLTTFISRSSYSYPRM